MAVACLIAAAVWGRSARYLRKVELRVEAEFGLDGTFWNGRLSTELTYYAKSSKDALVQRILPPSLGTGATSRFENLGEVTNKGIEALINARIIQRTQFGWEVTFTGSSNANKLVTLGGVPTIVSSSTLRWHVASQVSVAP